MSKFLILIYDKESAYANADQATMTRIMIEHNEFGTKNDSAVLGGNALEAVATAKSVRPDGNGGFAVTDGPFVETKEALGGYYLVEAADLDEAIELAKQVPVLEGGLEVRPIMAFE